jgi:hypothetical protein
MAATFYGLCTVTALVCSFLLLRAYARSRYKLLLWGGLCFLGLTVNNMLVILDLVVLGSAFDLYTLRLCVALASMMLLLYGVVWDVE